jgi:RNA repair pathway DNA polymerase beta family protein
MNTIVKIKFGSHLYGTSTPLSDTDYKSVFIPEARDIILQRAPRTMSMGTGRKKEEGERNLTTDVDNECYSLHYFLQLLKEGQTGAVDMLFAPDPEESTLLWDHLRMNRERLLTKKSAAFVGYCRTQANKYGIKGSRVAAAKRAMEFFQTAMDVHGTTEKVGTIVGPTPRVIDEFTSVVTKETTGGNWETYFVCCDRMVGFKNTLKEAASIFTRIHENYGARARMAESNEGIDWKALSHAVRVGHEAVELLKYHWITFPLPNAAHILEIKQGKLPYKVVAEEIEGLLVAVETASLSSALPEKADSAWIDDLLYRVYSKQIPWFTGRYDD